MDYICLCVDLKFSNVVLDFFQVDLNYQSYLSDKFVLLGFPNCLSSSTEFEIRLKG